MNKQSAEQCRTVGGCGESCESRVYKCIVQTRYQQAKFLEKLKQTESLCVCFILVRFNYILACLFLQIWLGECTQCELALRPRFYLQLFLTCTRLQSFAPLQLAIWIVSVPFLYRFTSRNGCVQRWTRFLLWISPKICPKKRSSVMCRTQELQLPGFGLALAQV